MRRQSYDSGRNTYKDEMKIFEVLTHIFFPEVFTKIVAIVDSQERETDSDGRVWRVSSQASRGVGMLKSTRVTCSPSGRWLGAS